MKRIDTETILIHFINENDGQYCTINQIQKLCGYVYQQLYEMKLLKNYIIRFAVDTESIEETVIYNAQIFYLDVDRDIIYLKNPDRIDALIKKYQIDNTIMELIQEFIQLGIA